MLPLKKFFPAIAWFFLVLVLICLPGYDLPSPDTWMNAVMFDKWIHAGLFSVLAFLFMRPFAISSLPVTKKLQALIKIAGCVSIWGLTTEFIQEFFIALRTFDWGDWIADSLGALLALIIVRKIYLRDKAKKDRHVSA
ncbi:MAG: VanZ family protein [Ferruginibacter sp.]